VKRPFRLEVHKLPHRGFAELCGISTFATEQSARAVIPTLPKERTWKIVERRHEMGPRGGAIEVRVVIAEGVS